MPSSTLHDAQRRDIAGQRDDLGVDLRDSAAPHVVDDPVLPMVSDKESRRSDRRSDRRGRAGREQHQRSEQDKGAGGQLHRHLLCVASTRKKMARRPDPAGAPACIRAQRAGDDEHNAYDLRRRQWFLEPDDAD